MSLCTINVQGCQQSYVPGQGCHQRVEESRGVSKYAAGRAGLIVFPHRMLAGRQTHIHTKHSQRDPTSDAMMATYSLPLPTMQVCLDADTMRFIPLSTARTARTANRTYIEVRTYLTFYTHAASIQSTDGYLDRVCIGECGEALSEASFRPDGDKMFRDLGGMQR